MAPWPSLLTSWSPLSSAPSILIHRLVLTPLGPRAHRHGCTWPQPSRLGPCSLLLMCHTVARVTLTISVTEPMVTHCIWKKCKVLGRTFGHREGLASLTPLMCLWPLFPHPSVPRLASCHCLGHTQHPCRWLFSVPVMRWWCLTSSEWGGAGVSTQRPSPGNHSERSSTRLHAYGISSSGKHF